MPRGMQLTKPIDQNVSECPAAFIKHCRIKNLSPRTIKLYKSECEYFIKWYGDDRGISQIDNEIIGDYIIHIKSTGISQAYVATKMRQQRAFLYFCMERNYLNTFKITIPKCDEVIKEPYTQQELERLLKKPTTNNWVEWRSWAMINYLLATGNRISTVVNIKISDIDFDNCMIKLRVLKIPQATFYSYVKRIKTSHNHIS